MATAGLPPLFEELPENQSSKNLSLFEMIKQGFSLVSALQNGQGMKRAADLLETNPKSVLFAGLIAMGIFLTICLGISQLVLHFLSV